MARAEELRGDGGSSRVRGRLEVAATCVTVEDGGEALILDRRCGTYYGLNETGTYVWQGLERGWTAEAVRENYASHFGVSAALAERDVEGLLETLIRAQLVSD